MVVPVVTVKLFSHGVERSPDAMAEAIPRRRRPFACLPTTAINTTTSFYSVFQPVFVFVDARRVNYERCMRTYGRLSTPDHDERSSHFSSYCATATLSCLFGFEARGQRR